MRVPGTGSWFVRATRWLNRLHAIWACLSPSAAAFTMMSDTRVTGSAERGRQIAEGNFLFAGFRLPAPGQDIWDLPMPSAGFEAAVHGFEWLDDLTAVCDFHTNRLAQDWTHEWIRRFGLGSGSGWTPELTGQRVLRWINHADQLLAGQGRAKSDAFRRSLSAQAVFLSRRWKTARPGLPRFEALTGLIQASAALSGMDSHMRRASRALSRECRSCIDSHGAIASRNPEELLEIFFLLNWAAAALQLAGQPPENGHRAAVTAVAPVLRSLRHVDGSLARFHGGGPGTVDKLDWALANAGVRGGAARRSELAMGYARVAHGRTTMIVDVAPPAATANAHASTLAFEMTSGLHPLVVNCGSGEVLGKSRRMVSRTTSSHSTLDVEGYSSSRFAASSDAFADSAERNVREPANVSLERNDYNDGTRIVAGHDGYLGRCGLNHWRTLQVDPAGSKVKGEDVLLAASDDGRKRFDALLSAQRLEGVPFNIRFHLHPDVEVDADEEGHDVSMSLKNGEIWRFRCRGEVALSLEPSDFLESTSSSSRATNQIVLSGLATEYSTRVGWLLAKARRSDGVIPEDELVLE
ncbi:MAG: heparinase [Boseongicola sp. SB0662_bin_57]|nr:heparinase [Boseongicola sp. SB0662_bin_57]